MCKRHGSWLELEDWVSERHVHEASSLLEKGRNDQWTAAQGLQEASGLKYWDGLAF